MNNKELAKRFISKTAINNVYWRHYWVIREHIPNCWARKVTYLKNVVTRTDIFPSNNQFTRMQARPHVNADELPCLSTPKG